MREFNLSVNGNKKTEIENKDFVIKWMVRKIPAKPYGGKIKKTVYEGSTSYTYKKDGKEKTEYFSVRNEDKDKAWNTLNDNIKSFVIGARNN